MVTEYQLARRERMNQYLDSLKEEAVRINGDESVIWLTKDFLTLLTEKLAKEGKVLEVPDCCPNNGSQGNFHVMFTWDKDEHYLECEIFYSGIVELFYRNRLTKEVWGGGLDAYAKIKINSEDTLFNKLSLFVE